jgi:alpha-tubulin suppressor-like RCC1 family protein
VVASRILPNIYVRYSRAAQVFAVTISCGTHHNAIIDADGELWTWGSNRFNCLGTIP